MGTKVPAIDSSQRELSKSDEFLGEGGTEAPGRRSEVVWEGGSEGVRGVHPGIEKTHFLPPSDFPRPFSIKNSSDSDSSR